MTTPCSVRAMAAARENAHAKVEQEAALARHRARLVGRGLLDDAGGEAWLVPRGHASLEASAADFEVLAEIHAAAARVDVSPRAAAAATAGTVVRRRATPPPRDDSAARAAAAAAGFGASSVVLPRLPVRPRYWDALASEPGFSPPAPPPPPRRRGRRPPRRRRGRPRRHVWRRCRHSGGRPAGAGWGARGRGRRRRGWEGAVEWCQGGRHHRRRPGRRVCEASAGGGGDGRPPVGVGD